MLCMAGFLTLHLSVCLPVCLCVRLQDISKILNRSTPFLVEAFRVTQGGNHSIWKKKRPWVRVSVGGGGVEIWPS